MWGIDNKKGRCGLPFAFFYQEVFSDRLSKKTSRDENGKRLTSQLRKNGDPEEIGELCADGKVPPCDSLVKHSNSLKRKIAHCQVAFPVDLYSRPNGSTTSSSARPSPPRHERINAALLDIWPDRPEFGRYSFEYEYLDQKRIKSEREKRARKRLHFLEPSAYHSRARAAGGTSRTNALAASDMILPCQTKTAPTAISSDHTVRTSMLFSSTSGLNHNRSNKVTTTDDLLTLGGIVPNARSPDLVPSEILRSSCSFRQDRSLAGSCSSLPSLIDNEMRLRLGPSYHFLGSATDQQALTALNIYPFVVFLTRGSSSRKLKVGFHVGKEARLFFVEMLNIEKGGTLWQITGTTYSIGFKTLEDMAHFYCRFPLTAE